VITYRCEILRYSVTRCIATICKQSSQINPLKYRKERVLMSRLALPIDNSEIRPSNIHGNGLFATRNISKGEIVTLYPGDILLYYPENHINTVKISRIGIIYGPHVPVEYKEKTNRDLEYFSDYEVKFSDSYHMMGIPNLVQDHCYLDTCAMMVRVFPDWMRYHYMKSFQKKK